MISSVEDKYEKKHKYAIEVSHSVSASRNWVTDEFWLRAKKCCNNHSDFISEGLNEKIVEGNLPVGMREKDDVINKEIRLAIGEGRINRSSGRNDVKLLVDRILECERAHRRQAGLPALLPGDIPRFRKRVNTRIKRALKNDTYYP